MIVLVCELGNGHWDTTREASPESPSKGVMVHGDIYLKDNDTDTDTAKGGADAHRVVRTAPRVRPVYVQRCAAPRACPKASGPATMASEGAARGRARTRPERHKCRRERV